MSALAPLIVVIDNYGDEDEPEGNTPETPDPAIVGDLRTGTTGDDAPNGRDLNDTPTAAEGSDTVFAGTGDDV